MNCLVAIVNRLVAWSEKSREPTINCKACRISWLNCLLDLLLLKIKNFNSNINRMEY